MKFPDDMKEFAHEVEDALRDAKEHVEVVIRDAKEHVILSVEQYSLQIAFVLMSITTAILVFGTIYVWCFHHPPHYEEEEKGEKEKEDKSVTKENGEEKKDGKKQMKSPSRIPSRQVSRQNDENAEFVKQQNSSAAEESQDESIVVARQPSESDDSPDVQCNEEPEEPVNVSVNGNLKLDVQTAATEKDVTRQNVSPQQSPSTKPSLLKFPSVTTNTQTDDVRRRKTSSSNNNNESPVKSKIPVRLQSQ